MKIANFQNECHRTASIIKDEFSKMAFPVTIKELIESIQERIINVHVTPALPVIFRGMKKVKPSIGLISNLELLAEWNKDWGKVVYTFYTGKDAEWDSYLAKVHNPALDNPWKITGNVSAKKGSRNEKLIKREAFLNRIFVQNNVTAKILRQERTQQGGGVFNTIDLGEIAAEPSTGSCWTDTNFRKECPWAFVFDVNTDFPMLYFGVFEYSKPLGFLQVILKWNHDLPDKDSEPFHNCFDKSNKIVSQILENSAYFVNTVIREILVFFNQQVAFFNNKQNLEMIYDKSFVTKVCDPELLQDESAPYAAQLREFKEYFDKGYCDAEKLALKTTCSLWKENILLSKNDELADLKKAETALFLSPKYREHLIHSDKVFLLGNYIIHHLSKNPVIKDIFLKNSFGEDIDSKYSKFQELWMLTATFHDFCIPIEYLSESQKSQYAKFMRTKKTELTDDYQKRIFLSNILSTEQMIYPLFHILHYHNPPDGDEECLNELKGKDGMYIFNIFEKDYHKFTGLSKYGIIHYDILRHFFQKGDHGISSAIRLLKECFPDNFDVLDKQSIIYREMEKWPGGIPDDKDERLSRANQIFKAYFQTIYAIFVHNFIEKMQEGKDKPIYDGALNFSSNTLAFLLLLCDTVQDWGREESYPEDITHSSRPLGQIKDIEIVGDKVRIDIKYSWIRYVDEVPVEVPINREPEGCASDDTIREYCKKNCIQTEAGDGKCAMKDKGACAFREKVSSKWYYIKHKLNSKPGPSITVNLHVGGNSVPIEIGE